MKLEYLKTLWVLRFKRMKKTEEEAAWGYQEILDRCLMGLSDHDSTIKLLQQLVKEERMHARLAEELIRIGHQNHPEVLSIDCDL